MTRLILALGAVLALSEFTPARAQFVIGPKHGFGYGTGYSSFYRSGFGFSVGGPNFRVSGFSGGFVKRSAFFAPPVAFVPAGFGPFAPVAPVGFVGPGFGPGFGYGWGPAFGPSVVAVPVPVPVFVGPPPNGNGNGAAKEPPPPEPPVLFPRANPNDFIVIAPRREDPIPIPLPLPGDKVAVVPKPVAPAPNPLKPPVPVKAEMPDADPKKEAARLVKLGRTSFAAGDFGRAAEHFERAATADPGDAMPYFLGGQAKFAAGQFAEAVARIRLGLERDPRWPAAPFNPTELYGDRPERFFLHLMALKKAVADNPNQATLEFLLGYQLWFSAEKVEADKLFRAAEKRLPAPGPLALFKLP